MSKNSKLKIILIFVAVCLVVGCQACVSYGFNSGEGGGTTVDYSGIKAAEAVTGDILNPVVLICFADESVEQTKASFTDAVRNYYIGESNSLQDYYSTISYGQIGITTLFPEADGELFVYQSTEKRSYYKNITNGSAKRSSAESQLLNSALKEATSHFDFTEYDLDKNGDGYVDSVSFLVSGKDSDGSGWGGLLWPHSWELTTISSASGITAAKLGGVTVNKFSFNFIETVDVGFLCHETGHVFGMPDLYHYYYDKDYVQVGQWDIMHLNQSTPQYPTVYLRDKYLGCIGDNQLIDIKTSGTYSLKPVSTATAEDILAYRLVINENESIYFEYRNNSVSVYDSGLSGSGLIVYRVNTSVKGNENGKRQNSKYPDEVYVYRPSVAATGATKNKELTNLSYAYLSVDNERFSSLGRQTSTDKYNEKDIFLTDGSNTGVSLEVTEKTDEELTFKIDVNGYGGTKVRNIIVEGDAEINYGETPDIRVKVLFSGYSQYVVASPDKYVLEYDSEIIGKQRATIVYTDDDGEEIKYYFDLTISDKLETERLDVIKNPDKVVYEAGEELSLDGLTVAVTYVKQGMKEIKYDLTDKSKWKADGVDTSVSGKYEAIITYLPFDMSVTIEITVVSDLVSVKISEKNSVTLVGRDESLSLTIIGEYKDGTERVLNPTEYTITGYSKQELYVRQTVRITSNVNSDIWCSKTIIAVDESDLLSITQEGKIKTLYKYGETLDLSGGTLTFDFSGNKISVPAENYYSLYSQKFQTTTKGLQRLVASIYGVENEYAVNVLASDDSSLASGSSAAVVNYGSGYVLFTRATKLKEAVGYFSSYLNIRFVKTDGKIKYEVKPSVNGEEYVTDGMRIELTDAEGKTVMSYRMFVKGDADGDGAVDENDCYYWAEALFRQRKDADIFLDMNGDGKYTLSDYVLLAETYGVGL